MAQSETTFTLFQSDEFKLIVIKISKVITEVWLYQRTQDGQKYPDGKIFLDGLDKGDEVSQILGSLGIEIGTDNFIKPVLDATSFNGGISVDPTVESSGNQPIRFLWEIPFFPDPTGVAVKTEILDSWVQECNQWLHKPTPDLPVPKSMYIPLSTS